MTVSGRRIGAATGLVLLGFSGLPLRAEILAIETYQRFGSPVAGLFLQCRFEPTCSHYGLKALEETGLVLGNLRIGARLLHCSPFGVAYDGLAWVAQRLLG